MRKNIGIFRGKRKDNGEWIEGFFTCATDCCGRSYFIDVPRKDPDDSNHRYEVDSETVCEFTGLTDQNGVKIFEGDIVGYFGKDFLNSLVTFDKGSFWFEFLSEYTRKIRDQKRDLIFPNVSVCGEVVGNQYDNPEMLEAGKENT